MSSNLFNYLCFFSFYFKKPFLRMISNLIIISISKVFFIMDFFFILNWFFFLYFVHSINKCFIGNMVFFFVFSIFSIVIWSVSGIFSIKCFCGIYIFFFWFVEKTIKLLKMFVLGKSLVNGNRKNPLFWKYLFLISKIKACLIKLGFGGERIMRLEGILVQTADRIRRWRFPVFPCNSPCNAYVFGYGTRIDHLGWRHYWIPI